MTPKQPEQHSALEKHYNISKIADSKEEEDRSQTLSDIITDAEAIRIEAFGDSQTE